MCQFIGEFKQVVGCAWHERSDVWASEELSNVFKLVVLKHLPEEELKALHMQVVAHELLQLLQLADLARHVTFSFLHLDSDNRWSLGNWGICGDFRARNIVTDNRGHIVICACSLHTLVRDLFARFLLSSRFCL